MKLPSIGVGDTTPGVYFPIIMELARGVLPLLVTDDKKLLKLPRMFVTYPLVCLLIIYTSPLFNVLMEGPPRKKLSAPA